VPCISFQQPSGDWHVDYEDSRKADGIILLGYGDYLEALPRLEQLVDQGTHFVRWGAARAGQVGTTVGSDNEHGGYLAGKHLVERGRHSIAFLGTATHATPEYLERYRGFRRALEEAGMEHGLLVDATASEESGRAAVRQLLADGTPFDAVFAINDLTAIGAMRELHDAGLRVPEDVAIVGFDDLAAARLAEPPITTIAQDTKRAGDALVETLIAKIDEHAPVSVMLPVELVVRAST